MKIENYNFQIEQKDIEFGDGKHVKVKTYLPVKEKIELLNFIINEAFEVPIINQPKLDALFNMMVLLKYSDIEIEDQSIDHLLEVYDYFEYNGYIDAILKKIPKIEIDSLIGYLDDTIKDFNKYKVSIAGTMESVVNILPTLMENIDVLKEDLRESDLEIAKTLYDKLKH